MVKIDGDRISIKDESGEERTYEIGSATAFKILSDLWLRSGWGAKYVYSFSWLGVPVIQLPEDLLRVQEAIFSVQPDVIVETGIAHGGSLIFYASLCAAMGRGRVIGVDVDIRKHNREAIEAHRLSGLVTLVEGNSIDPLTVSTVKSLIQPDLRVFVVLDSAHSKDHVAAELQAYAPLVSVGSYIVAADGIMAKMARAERASEDWTWNNPREAVRAFQSEHPEFVIETPRARFNEGQVIDPVTYWVDGWLKRVG